MHMVQAKQAPSSSGFPRSFLPKPSELVSRQEEGSLAGAVWQHLNPFMQAGGKEAAARQGGGQGQSWCAAQPCLQSSRSLIGLN